MAPPAPSPQHAPSFPNGNVAEPPQAGYRPPSPLGSQEDGIRIMQDSFQNARVTPHWPMYLRNVKQFIKNAMPTFDERAYGFANFLEAVRAAQRGGVFRLERNRQGILRVYPGSQIPQPSREAPPVFEAPPTQDEVVMVEAEPIIEAAPVETRMPDEEMFSDEEPEVEEVPAEEIHAAKPAARKRRAVAAAPSAAPKKKASPGKPRTTISRRTRKKPSDESQD
jgi:hypothetical protein